MPIIVVGLFVVGYAIADMRIDRAFRRSGVRLPATIIGSRSELRGGRFIRHILPRIEVLEIEYVTPDGVHTSNKQARLRRPVRGNEIEILYKPTGRARVRTPDALERTHWLKLSIGIALIRLGVLVILI